MFCARKSSMMRTRQHILRCLMKKLYENAFNDEKKNLLNEMRSQNKDEKGEI